MAIRSKDIYKGKKKARGVLKALVITALLLIAAAITLFFVLRQYAVYDENGNATIVLPFLGESAPAGEETPQ